MQQEPMNLTVVMLDQLARVVTSELIKALVWAAVFAPILWLTRRRG